MSSSHATLAAPVTESPPRTDLPETQVSLMFSSVNVLHSDCCGVSEQSLVVYGQSSMPLAGGVGGAQVEEHTSAPQSPVQVTSWLKTDIS